MEDDDMFGLIACPKPKPQPIPRPRPPLARVLQVHFKLLMSFFFILLIGLSSQKFKTEDDDMIKFMRIRPNPPKPITRP